MKTKRRKITKRDLSLKCDSIANNDEDVEVNIISGNDKKSTIAYEMEDNLNYILDQISEISSEMISSITMEYSENEIVNSVLQILPEQTKDFLQNLPHIGIEFNVRIQTLWSCYRKFKIKRKI